MAKPRIIIADTDSNYIMPLQLKFVEDHFEQVELEIITSAAYFAEFLSSPQQAGILIVSQQLYSQSIRRHNIGHIFVMTEQYEEEQTSELNVSYIFKYTSIKEIFNEIIGKSPEVFASEGPKKQQTQVVLFCSASGGTGKTTVSMGVSASLTKNYKRVLYINAAYLQCFQQMLENKAPVTVNDIYTKLAKANDKIYSEIKHAIRKELFSYLPPFKAALMSLGLGYGIYDQIIQSAKQSGEYDFIIVDADTTFDEPKARLLNRADKVVIVTDQSRAAVAATNGLVANINGVGAEKYLFVCNKFQKEEESALVSSATALRFSINEYIEYLPRCEQMDLDELSRQSGIQRIAFLII